MACCLKAKSHYLNQCWLITKGFLRQSPESNSIGIAENINSKWNIRFQNHFPHLPGANDLIQHRTYRDNMHLLVDPVWYISETFPGYLANIPVQSKQERLKRRNILGCLDQYAAQNNKYARPPIPSQPPTQNVFFQWHTQYDPTMKHSHCETVYAKELFQWLFFELVHSLRIL